jgi:hypothetical protein
LLRWGFTDDLVEEQPGKLGATGVRRILAWTRATMRKEIEDIVVTG